MYSSTFPSTSAQDVCGWLTPRTGRFTAPGRTRYPLYRRLGWPQGHSRQVPKISPPPGFDPRSRPARSDSLYRLMKIITSYNVSSNERGLLYPKSSEHIQSPGDLEMRT